jgi:hypothetical protein
LSIPSHDVIPDGDGYRLPVVHPPGDLRSVFKVTSENLTNGDRWTPSLHCYATAQKRYVLFRQEAGRMVSPKSSAFVLGTLANFRPDGELDWYAVEEAWRIGPDLAERMAPVGPVGIDLTEPVFQPMVMAALRDWRALGRLKFSTESPQWHPAVRDCPGAGSAFLTTPGRHPLQRHGRTVGRQARRSHVRRPSLPYPVNATRG